MGAYSDYFGRTSTARMAARADFGYEPALVSELGRAEAEVHGVATLCGLVGAGTIRAEAAAGLTGGASGLRAWAHGRSVVEDLRVGGDDFPIVAPPNTVIPLPGGLGTVNANEIVRESRADGAQTVLVNAIRVHLDAALGRPQAGLDVVRARGYAGVGHYGCPPPAPSP